jgi:hypothetical protein
MKRVLLTMMTAVLAACAGTATTKLPSHTMLKEGGIYQTSGYGMTQDDSEKSANYNAGETCSLQKKIPVVSRKDSRYQGTLGEDINKTVNMVSALLKSTTGKSYGTTATDKDYKTTLDYRCQ